MDDRKGNAVKREKYQELKSYMQECMSDAAHDKEHVWRVLGYALRLAAELKEPVDHDLLIAACLLHDIGRAAQFRDPSLDHAAVGADMAAGWLSDHGYSPGFCQAVRSAIRSHRYRTGGRAESIEAQLLFDSDKLDVCGIMGLLRTVSYCDHVGEPYYTVGENGLVEFTADSEASVVQEYCYKLRQVKERLYTDGAKRLAEELSHQLDTAVNAVVQQANFARTGLAELESRLL